MGNTFVRLKHDIENEFLLLKMNFWKSDVENELPMLKMKFYVLKMTFHLLEMMFWSDENELQMV